MNKSEYMFLKKKYQARNHEIEQRQELDEIKNKYKKKRGISTSKLIVFIVFVLAIEIILFTEYSMLKFQDFSAMYALIGVPTTLVPTLIAYFNKAKAENTQSGITYDLAMRETQQQLETGGTPDDSDVVG